MSKKWILKSSDDKTFEVDEAVALQSLTVKEVIEEITGENNTVTLYNVNANILAKMIDYCKKHAETPSDADARKELNKFDAEFVNLDKNGLTELLMAADYLNIPGLLHLIHRAIADKIKDMQPEEFREYFSIENDFTKEEEEAVIKENQWCFK